MKQLVLVKHLIIGVTSFLTLTMLHAGTQPTFTLIPTTINLPLNGVATVCCY